jgi:hypothetical protein
VQGISDHCGVLLEVERGEKYREPQAERLVPVYHEKTFQVFIVSCRINSHDGQVIVVAWRVLGNVLRKSSSRISIVLSHIKF